MTRAGAAGARFRQRKLSTKQTLQILQEDQVEKVEDDQQQRNIPKFETGVEKGEEIEHHLQAAISASQAAAIGGKVAQIYIPTPDAKQSKIQYDQLYPPRFSQPATYIRFSSTVEDCSGCQYCMKEDDELFLKSLNEKSKGQKCTEDQFEQVCDFFERTSSAKQPFAAVDHPPVPVYEELEALFDETVDEDARVFARDVYEHWRSQRVNNENRPLMPSLKLETGQETDDADPYVCFRRREVRQARKTRGRDALSADKLKKLRRELEEARQLVAMVKQRELTRKELLAVDRNLFGQRSKVKDAKRKLGIKGDDEDLINQKPQKKKAALEAAAGAQRPPGAVLRMPPRPGDIKSSEQDLVLLSDVLAEKENEIEREIEQKVQQHKNWNNGYLDFTLAPLTPKSSTSSAGGPDRSFRTAVTQYLPTPPASASSENSANSEHNGGDLGSPTGHKDHSITVRYASPSEDAISRKQPSFRRRIGRGGRLMIDRRDMHLQSKAGIDPLVLDRFKYDYDDDDDEEDDVPTFTYDQYDTLSMRYRASVFGQQTRQAPRPQGAVDASSQSRQNAAMAVAAANQAQMQHQSPRRPVSSSAS